MLAVGMASLRSALAISPLFLLGVKLPAAARDPGTTTPGCPTSGVRGLAPEASLEAWGAARHPRSFYLASELAELRGRSSAGDWSSREARHIDLLPVEPAVGNAPELPELEVALHGSGEPDHCRATNLQRPDRCFDFDLTCDPKAGAMGAFEVRSAHWIWLDAHRALTDLLSRSSSAPSDGSATCPGTFRELSLLRDPYLALLKDPAYPEHPLQEVVEVENPSDVAALIKRAQDAGAFGMRPLPADAKGCR